jgi:hypothetical protein
LNIQQFLCHQFASIVLHSFDRCAIWRYTMSELAEIVAVAALAHRFVLFLAAAKNSAAGGQRFIGWCQTATSLGWTCALALWSVEASGILMFSSAIKLYFGAASTVVYVAA